MQSWKWPAAAVFRNVRFRYGIKLGLAGLLALFLTQILRLPYDSWAILTVLTTMSARYVGSAAVNAITQIIGTTCGAIVGVLLVGNYISTPIIFLPVLFLVMGFATYMFGQVGPRQAPYSYYVLGMATLVIATNGIAAPDQVWQLGLYRAEEILVGVVSALVVSSICWPRYAGQEFLTAARDTLRGVEPLLLAQTETSAHRLTNLKIDEIRETFAENLAALNNLRQAAARESTLFSAQLPHYDTILVSLSSVCDAALYLTARPFKDGPIINRLLKELDQVYRGLVEEIRILSAPAVIGGQLRASSSNAAFADLEQKVEELQAQGFLLVEPIADDVTFGSHFAALRTLRDKLNSLRNIIEGFLKHRDSIPVRKGRRKASRKIDKSWVKIGIKGGLAATIAVTLLMWAHPPGASFIPLTAWLRVVISRTTFRSGAAGDLRALQKAFVGCLFLALCAVVALATTPFLASYFAMNLALFVVLFAFGVATSNVGLTFVVQLGFLIISAFVSLNPQQPVLSQTIIDTFLGIGIGLFIGAAVRRFVWPSLPQTVFRENLIGTLADVKCLLSGERLRKVNLIRLAARSLEAYQVVARMPLSARWQAKRERDRLHGVTMELLALAPRVIHLTAIRYDLPKPVEAFLRLPLQRLRVRFMQLLDDFAGYIQEASSNRRDLPTLGTSLAETDRALRTVRDRMELTSYPIGVSLATLDIVGRYQAAAETLNNLRASIIHARIHRYWGDYAL